MYSDLDYMQQVLNLAKLTQFQTQPNPQVAALIIKKQQVLGVGVHLHAGTKHAEVLALEQAGVDASGATLYINLEPCAHYGHTPPCCNAIIQAQIARVVVANLDPNPLVASRGIKQLREAGIEVEVGLCAEAAAQLNQRFFHYIQSKQAYVTLKVALSLDGKIATSSGVSQWISSELSRRDVHLYRLSHDAILVGVNTVIKDDPLLTPYLIDKPSRYPVRLILDNQLRTPLSARVISNQSAPTWIFTSNNDLNLHVKYQTAGVKIIYLTKLDINDVLSYLYQAQIYSVLVEGGEAVYSSFLDAKAVNQLICYYSPQLIGNAKAKQFFAGTGFNNLQTNLKLKIIETKLIAEDLKLSAIYERNY